MRIRIEQRSELQVPVTEQLVHDLVVALVDIQNPDVTAQGTHILDDLIGLRLSQAEIVLLHLALLHQLHKSIRNKRIMLCRYREIDRAALLAGIAVLHEFGLLNNLPGITQEFHAFG